MDEDNQPSQPAADAGGKLNVPDNAEPGPLGRTRREEQRRRLIVAGAMTPALMSLPSRRVWAVKCSKSKMLSGNLSAKKMLGAPDCDPMGCNKKFWEGHQEVRGVVWSGQSFDLNLGGTVYGSATMWQVLKGLDPPQASDKNGFPWYGVARNDLKECAKFAVVAFLNATFLVWPPPNDMFNFELTQAQVSALWAQAVSLALQQNENGVKAIKDQLKAASESMKTCPF